MKFALGPLLATGGATGGLLALIVATMTAPASGQQRQLRTSSVMRRGQMADGHDNRGERVHAEGYVAPQAQRRRGLSIEHFGDILISEVESEYGQNDADPKSGLTEEETLALWEAASDHEWDRARSSTSNVFLMGMPSVNGTGTAPSSSSSGSLFPFLVCDPEERKSGNDCRQNISHHFGDHLMAVSNAENMTCFVVSASASAAESAPDNLFVHPFMPEVKLQRGLMDDIVDAVSLSSTEQQNSSTAATATEDHNNSLSFANSSSSSYNNNSSLSSSPPPPQRLRLYSVFCPRWSTSQSDAEFIIADIMSSLPVEEGDVASSSRRFLRLMDDDEELNDSEGNAGKSEVLSKALRKKRKASRRSLATSNNSSSSSASSSCADLFSTLNATADPDSGDSFAIDVPLNNNDTSSSSSASAMSSCLLRLIEHLSTSPSICSVGLLPEMTTSNAEAQWIIQGGSGGGAGDAGRPFFRKGITGKNEVVACSDSGLDMDHCYFKDSTGKVRFGGTVDQSKRKVVQYVNYADSTDDYYGHGTHVVGTICGRRSADGRTESDGEGDGIARDAKVAFFDIGKTNTWFLDIPQSFSDLFNPGRNAGAKIHSASWGSNFNGYGYDERAFDSYMRQNDDFIVVIAAGNSGSRRNTVGSPATCKNGISVGASRNGNSRNQIAGFSSRGPTADGRTKPDVVAPGSTIVSAAAGTNTCGSNSLFGQDGTSMSAPVVSGAAALVRQYFMDGFYPTGTEGGGSALNPSGQLVKAVLLNGARSLNGMQPYDVNQNFGLINLLNSLPLEGENTIGAKVVDRKNIRAGQTDTIVLDINTNGCTANEVSATLCWADPPAFTNCKQCVLNDLDLYITKQGDQRTYYANGKNARDKKNNAERVRLPASNGDRITVHVEAANLDETSQDYALIVTGCFSADGGTPPGGNPPVPPSPTPGPPVSPPVSTPVAPPVQPPVQPPSAGPKSIETNLAGQKSWDGNMFDVRAKKDVVISSLSFHTSSTQANIPVEVWTKKGTRLGSEWTQVAAANVQGRGQGQLTEIPAESFGQGEGVTMQEGETLSFYVTTGDTNSMMMSEGTALGQNSAENEDVAIMEGFASTYQFGSVFYPYAWNGKISYSLGGGTPGGTEGSIETEMVTDTQYWYYGYFFDVEYAVGTDLPPPSIYELDIHTSFVGSMTVDVWTKSGTYDGYENSINSGAWTQVVTGGTIQGRGRGVWTTIPSTLFDSEVTVERGMTAGFYVKISEDGLLYSDGAGIYDDGTGDGVAVRTGASKGPSGVYKPRSAHVVVRFRK